MKWRWVGPLRSAPKLPAAAAATAKQLDSVESSNAESSAEAANPRSGSERRRIMPHRDTGGSKDMGSASMPPIPNMVVALHVPLKSVRKNSVLETDDESSFNDSCTSKTGVYFNDSELSHPLHPLQMCNSSSSSSYGDSQTMPTLSENSAFAKGKPLRMPPPLAFHQQVTAIPPRPPPPPAAPQREKRITNIVSQLRNTNMLGNRRRKLAAIPPPSKNVKFNSNPLSHPPPQYHDGIKKQPGANHMNMPPAPRDRTLSEEQKLFLEAATTLRAVDIRTER